MSHLIAGAHDPPERAAQHLLAGLGHDLSRDGLRDTPRRLVGMLREMTSGYAADVPGLLTVFENDARYDEMVSVGPIMFHSLCEHHIAPFFGDAWVSYIPADGRIVGLSKLARVVDAYARRLQVQERLTAQIADALADNLGPKGVGVQVRARHLCMEMRGVRKPGAVTTTTALRGVFLDKPEARAEFLAAVG